MQKSKRKEVKDCFNICFLPRPPVCEVSKFTPTLSPHEREELKQPGTVTKASNSISMVYWCRQTPRGQGVKWALALSTHL
jgi:hypothetical protein